LIIDAHHHMWECNLRDYAWMSDAMPSLRNDFLVPELLQVMVESGVTGTVAVQARQEIEETKWLLELANPPSPLLGVVGWIPLIDRDARACLEHLAASLALKAVWHILDDEPVAFYTFRGDFNSGVGLLQEFGLAYDILIFERHLPQTLRFVDRHTNQVFVLDQVGKPRIREELLSSWRENVGELAERENVYCKVSGMVTESDRTGWSEDDLRPYFDVILSSFGPRRLMFGSDWPVLNLAGGYKSWINGFRSLLQELTPDEQENVCRNIATSVYNLQPNG
jgi:L-fuconolactonase